MVTNTFQLIQKLSDERRHLYELAGNELLMPEQRQRLDEINDRLPVLWDLYRRELAAQDGPAIKLTGADRLQQSVISEWTQAEERQAA